MQSCVYVDDGCCELPRVYKRRALQQQSSRKEFANRKLKQVNATAPDEMDGNVGRSILPSAEPNIRTGSKKHETGQQNGVMKLLAARDSHRIGRQVLRNPGLARIAYLDVNRPTLKCLDCEDSDVKAAVMTITPEAYLHSRASKAVLRVPLPPCRDALRLRWLQFLMESEVDPQLCTNLRASVFWAAQQESKEQHLGWSHRSCSEIHAFLSENPQDPSVALSQREQRIAKAILTLYFPSSRMEHASEANLKGLAHGPNLHKDTMLNAVRMMDRVSAKAGWHACVPKDSDSQ